VPTVSQRASWAARPPPGTNARFQDHQLSCHYAITMANSGQVQSPSPNPVLPFAFLFRFPLFAVLGPSVTQSSRLLSICEDFSRTKQNPILIFLPSIFLPAPPDSETGKKMEGQKDGDQVPLVAASLPCVFCISGVHSALRYVFAAPCHSHSSLRCLVFKSCIGAPSAAKNRALRHQKPQNP